MDTAKHHFFIHCESIDGEDLSLLTVARDLDEALRYWVDWYTVDLLGEDLSYIDWQEDGLRVTTNNSVSAVALGPVNWGSEAEQVITAICSTGQTTLYRGSAGSAAIRQALNS